MIIVGDCLTELKKIETESVDCVVTSPPYYGLRDYGVSGQIGLENHPNEYIENMRLVFNEVRRVMKKEATLWLNLGDSYAAGGRGAGTKKLSDKQSTNAGSVHLQKKIETSGEKKRFLKPPDGFKRKDLIGIPWRVAFALQNDGWYLRQDIIWAKPNPMPESVRDRCTKAHEYIFLLSKQEKYYFDLDAIKEPASYGLPDSPHKIKSPYGQGFTRRAKGGGKKLSKNAVFAHRNDTQNLDKAGEKIWHTRQKRSVWIKSTKPFKGAHFATFPQDLIEPCILAGCPENGIVLDPFFGAGTTGVVAMKHNRKFIGIEINEKYADIARNRLKNIQTQMRIVL